MPQRHAVASRPRILGAVLLLIASLAGCGDNSPTAPSLGLDIPFATVDLVVGTGPEAMNGDTLLVNYTGWLYDVIAADNKGSQFDQGEFEFVLGAGAVIPGWDRGMLGMRAGGHRRIIVPPELGYGAAGFPPTIPGNATLLFEVELLEIR